MNIFDPTNLLPDNDQERVLALDKYAIFNAPREKAFDNIVSLAQAIFKVPIAHLSFLDDKHEFVMASEGLGHVGLIPREESLCALTVLRADVVIIENALEEPLLTSHPYVNGDFGLRFYAGAPIITPDNFVIGTLCLVDQKPRNLSEHEITVLKELAKVAMEQLELRMVNLEKTKSLALANQRLKEQITQKDEFIGIVSHELRTPITALKGYVQILSRKAPLDESISTKMLQQAEKSTEKLNGLVDDLLSVSKIVNNVLQLHQAPTQVQDLLDTCCRTIELPATQQIVISGDTMLKVNVDRKQIERLLNNLLDNAIKYAPNSKTIEVKVLKKGNFAEITVSDKGPGIMAEKLNLLFERYNRSYDATTQSHGLGLGLFFSAQLIKLHGGEIGVDSSQEKGSKFWFTLPLAQNFEMN
ncbi:GAF domain-containing sensor histidine kinase [Pedobacter namyangjuensis]|uniref:GAF domain-containing sensor histidine kinase n=1 Tax=Pedobacter namyangjuensis TaxID=600626 RepID=UPI000DE54E6B|nr:GAF domain-containing sensor histidine kinase [Pedobacter namyangjuensis]